MEDGEIEYGGSTETKNRPYYTVNYAKSVYLAGAYQNINQLGLDKKDLSMYLFPSDEEMNEKDQDSLVGDFIERVGKIN